MKNFLMLKRFYKPYTPLAMASLLMLVVTVALGLVYPYLLRAIVNHVIVGKHYGDLWKYAIGILLASCAKGIFNYGQQYSGQKFGTNAGYDLRNALYKKLNQQSFHYYDNVHTGDLMSRMTSDFEAFRQFLSWGLNSVVNFFLLLIFGLSLMFTMNVTLSIVAILLMPFLAFVAIKFDNKLWPAYRNVRKKVGELNTAVQENISGVRTVKSFAKERQEVDKFETRNTNYFEANLSTMALWRKFFPYMELIGNVGVVAIIVVGGYLVIERQMSLGDLVAFLSVLWYITFPMSQLGFLLNNWTQCVAAAERLNEVLEAPVSVETPGNSQVTPVTGYVQFDHVSVEYNGQTVLQDIQFEAKPGQTIAILGPTGAGKSTMLNLIPRFYDVAAGVVRVDGTDVREWDLNKLRSKVAVVFQESFLFSTTIFANIAFGNPDATMEEVRRAAKMADAAEFIDALPDGYATLVGERGLGLSGGQKQRIALARAILSNPSILILDDATSAVDMETEYEIQQALEQVMRDRTTFIVAHRVSSLKRADLILVVQEGKIVQRGTHDTLLAQGGLYRQIYDLQFRDHDEIKAFTAQAATV